MFGLELSRTSEDDGCDLLRHADGRLNSGSRCPALTYGMTRSSYVRGRITMIEKLMKALIAGRSVGPVEAIGQDYRALELKGVVEVVPAPPRGYYMKLLKKAKGKRPAVADGSQ